MAERNVTEIGSGIRGLNVLNALRNVYSDLTSHQLRRAAGRRINSAGDDPAGLTIATRLHGRSKVPEPIFDDIGEAK